jgi:hypothetical protein
MKIGQEALAVVGAVTVIRRFRRLIDAIERVVGEITLCAPRGLTHKAHGFELKQQVLRGLIDVQHPVDDFPRRTLPRSQATNGEITSNVRF